MNKVLGEYYIPIIWALWMVGIPMTVKGEFGIIAALCASVVAAGIAVLLTNLTAAKAEKTKLFTLIGSVALIVCFMALVIEPEPANNSTELPATAE